MSNRLESGLYVSIAHLGDDFATITNNAITFNEVRGVRCLSLCARVPSCGCGSSMVTRPPTAKKQKKKPKKPRPPLSVLTYRFLISRRWQDGSYYNKAAKNLARLGKTLFERARRDLQNASIPRTMVPPAAMASVVDLRAALDLAPEKKIVRHVPCFF